MRFLLIGLTIVLFSLTTACSELALTRSPEAEATDVQQEQSQPEQSESQQNEPQEDEQVAQSPESQAGEPDAQSGETEPGPSAQLVADLKSILAAQTGIPSHEISLVSAEAVNWSDACLGISSPDELCAQVITPGYRVILSRLDRQYELHTDRAGKNVRIKEESEG